MRCPYQTITTHKPEYTDRDGEHCAKDIVEFGNCLKSECPFYYTSLDWELNSWEHCRRTEGEGKE